jgi:hypothetical protein
VPQLRWESGKGAKLRGKVKAESSSEAASLAKFLLRYSQEVSRRSYLTARNFSHFMVDFVLFRWHSLKTIFL